MKRLPKGTHGAAQSPRHQGFGASDWSTGKESWVAFHGCSGSGMPRGRPSLPVCRSLATNIPEHRESEGDHPLEIGTVGGRRGELPAQNVIDVLMEDGLDPVAMLLALSRSRRLRIGLQQ